MIRELPSLRGASTGEQTRRDRIGASLSQWPRRLASLARTRRVPLTLCGIALLPVLVPFLSPADDTRLIYPYAVLVELLPIPFCLHFSARLRGVDRLPWLCISIHFLLRSLAYLGPSFAAWGHLAPRTSAWAVSGFSSLCYAFSLFAFMGFARGHDRRITLLDCVSIFTLACLLVVSLSSFAGSGLRVGHLVVAFAALAFIALIAAAARLGAATPAEASFSFIVATYFGVRLVDNFIINIVDYTLLPTPLVLPSDLLMGVPALAFCFLVYRASRSPAAPQPPRPVRLLIQSLLPATLVLGSGLLAPYAFGSHRFWAAGFLLFMVLCYTARTHLLYCAMLQEQLSLQSRASYLEDLATRDDLTGIGNRRWFDRAAGHLLLGVRHPGAALLVLDTDNFKGVNDRFGHLAGDDVLRLIARLLDAEIAPIADACCARLGGDEFIALLPNCHRDAAAALADRLRHAVRAHTFDAPVEASVSIGIALAYGPVSLTGMIRSADAALYRAKARGGNSLEVVDASTPQQSPPRDVHERSRPFAAPAAAPPVAETASLLNERVGCSTLLPAPPSTS